MNQYENSNELSSIKDTVLWKKLDAFDGDLEKKLATNLIDICKEAANRIKIMPTYAPQYTLHDEVHLLNVTELIAEDVVHSQDEKRYYCFGLNQDKSGVLTVRFTYRSGCIRIFGAGYWRKGKKTYEQANSI